MIINNSSSSSSSSYRNIEIAGKSNKAVAKSLVKMLEASVEKTCYQKLTSLKFKDPSTSLLKLVQSSKSSITNSIAAAAVGRVGDNSAISEVRKMFADRRAMNAHEPDSDVGVIDRKYILANVEDVNASLFLGIGIRGLADIKKVVSVLVNNRFRLVYESNKQFRIVDPLHRNIDQIQLMLPSLYERMRPSIFKDEQGNKKLRFTLKSTDIAFEAIASTQSFSTSMQSASIPNYNQNPGLILFMDVKGMTWSTIEQLSVTDKLNIGQVVRLFKNNNMTLSYDATNQTYLITDSNLSLERLQNLVADAVPLIKLEISESSGNKTIKFIPT